MLNRTKIINFLNVKIPNLVIKKSKLNNLVIAWNGEDYQLLDTSITPPVQLMQFGKDRLEMKELYSSFDLAHGNVLVGGLGFGILTCWLATKPEVAKITVVEKRQDVVDLFLTNNSLPNNVKIVVCDINEFTTEEHFDCVLLDSFDDWDHKIDYDNLRAVSQKIPHNLFWFWSLEHRYVKDMYKLTTPQLYGSAIKIDPKNENYLDLTSMDLADRWEDWLKLVAIPTIPTLLPDTLQEYVETYFGRR